MIVINLWGLSEINARDVERIKNIECRVGNSRDTTFI